MLHYTVKYNFVYIFSGVLTPSKARPFFITIATDFISAILERRSLSSFCADYGNFVVKMIEKLGQFFQIHGDKVRRIMLLRF